MDHPPHDTGAQFILDNRKLIVGFALLIVLCGTFFVIGFMEGKRQGIQRAKEQLPSNAANSQAANPQETQPDRSSLQPAKPLEDKSVREQLEWYKNVNKREDAGLAQSTPPAKPPETAAQPAAETADNPAPAAAASAAPAGKSASSPKAKAISAPKITYTVQVGAFKQRREAEAKAAALKERNYEYFIEAAGGAEPLFMLKVGRFESRAEAVAMQLKLKKDGFSTFIKTNQ